LSEQLSRALRLQSVKAMYRNQEAFKLPLYKGKHAHWLQHF